ncbi:MAG: hypothetical protein ACYSWP_00240 [Planctomycetota bacterium]|jgi:hypothetical protein
MKMLNGSNRIQSFGILAVLLFSLTIPVQVWACRGDVAGIGGPPPDGIVTTWDVYAVTVYMNTLGDPCNNYIVEAFGLPNADVADMNSIGGGDGWISSGDLLFYYDVMMTPYAPDGDPMLLFTVPCLPTSFEANSVTEIRIEVNEVPWDGISPVSPNDVIQLTWAENDPNKWWGGFVNFNLNVSRGEYTNDLNSSIGWESGYFSAGPDGQGGIDIGGDWYAWAYFTQAEIFTFSFRVPDEVGDAYTINIRPNRGSWLRVQYDQLPQVNLPVSAKEAECVNRPTYDFSGDCIVNFIDMSMFLTQWLDCGYEPNDACWE